MEIRAEKGGRWEKVWRAPQLLVCARRLTASREMQLFLLGFIIVEICEIFTVGGFPLNGAVRRVSSIHGWAHSLFEG